MTDKKDSALPDNSDSLSDSKPSESIAPSSAPSNDRSARPGKTLPTLALLVGVAALGLSGWQFYQDHYMPGAQDPTTIHNKFNALEGQLSALDKTVKRNANASRQVPELIDDMAATQAQAADIKLATEQALVKLSSKINKLNNADKNDWLLAEAQYLIRLANQRLLLEKDTRSTILLLTNADSILESLEDPLVFDTRKAIASDIQALKSIAAFDLEGRYLQLAALYDQVAELPQREPSKKWQAQRQSDTTASNTQTSHLSAIERLFTEAWQGIKSLVVVNYNQKPIKPLLPPAEYQELVTGIQLQLDVAQVALLKGEEAIYEKALSRVAATVTEHFDPRSQATIAFTTTLTSLQQVNPNPDVPMPRASLQAMKKLMQNWNNSTIDEGVSQ